jgi:uncharacterized protein (TIGR00159 family)
MEIFNFRVVDLIDILLVAFLLFQVYRLLKGTVAINILIGVGAIYLIWKGVELLHMELLSEILGQFIGVGVIALIVVFQQEVRKFLLYIGTTDFGQQKGIMGIFGWNRRNLNNQVDFATIAQACASFSETKTGAIMVVTRKTGLGSFESTGDRLDARISVTLLESIFQKESPLHDGAVIITGTRITAARCVLPVSEQESLPSRMGMRHRAALGLAERTDALIAVVSEQTGEISLAQEGQLSSRLKPKELEEKMRKAYSG